MLRGALAFLLLIASATATRAAEEILLFSSNVEVQVDGNFLVTETIRVNAEGEKIKRGIYRDIPLLSKDDTDPLDSRFALISANRDGQPENVRIEENDGFVRIYLGRKEVLLRPATYTYEITYRTKGQILTVDNHDVIAWNTTGVWGFQIRKAVAIITLPEGAIITGGDFRAGTKETKALAITHPGDNVVTFESTKPLDPGESLVVAVTFKGAFTKASADSPDWPFQAGNAIMLGAPVLASPLPPDSLRI